ncbi:fimbrial protein [Salmonella enterica]|nr:fimbrial protein [Salmonella enterica]
MMIFFLLTASLTPFGVLAWNAPGKDFSGDLKLEGTVTNTHNPWVWEVGKGNKNLNSKQKRYRRSGEKHIPIPLPALTIMLGKTTLVTPAGREGLSPRVTYGKNSEDFSLVWIKPGVAEVTLPAFGENNIRVGTFIFRMQVASVLRHLQDEAVVYNNVYDDLNANGLPDETRVMKAGLIPGFLQIAFGGEGPYWLKDMGVTGTAGLSHFSEASFRQVDGAYAAQIVADSGELRLCSEMPERWSVSLPVSIEYQ